MKKLIKKIPTKLLNLTEKFCSNNNITKLLNTSVGIKPLNQIICSNYYDDEILKILPNIRYEKLLSNPDFLIDRHTNLNKHINDWPHYHLIKCLDQNLNFDNCEYVQRAKNGTLDFRKKFEIYHKTSKQIFAEKIKKIERNQDFSIKIFNVFDDFYAVADGKHSLAMAYYFKYPKLRFELIRNYCFDTYYRWIFEKIKNNSNYKKHNSFFRRTHEHRKKQIDKIIN